MPNEANFLIELDGDVTRIRVRFSSDRAMVIEFLVQLETVHDRQWKPVRRCDDHHGKPHMDFLDRWGREYRKEWLDADRNTALTLAIQDFKMHWETYVAEFLGGDSHEQRT